MTRTAVERRALGPHLVVAAALLVALGSSACTARDPVDGGGVIAVAAVFPLAQVAREVAPTATVTLLGAGGDDAHSVDLTPRERAAVEAADVMLYVGDIGYQKPVERAAEAAQGQVVDMAAIAGPSRVITTTNGAVDPHLWFDARVMADVTVATGDAFAAADPGGARDYRARAAGMASDFRRLAVELDDLLAGDCRFDEVVVSHVAYAYLTKPRGKTLLGITSPNPEAGASPAELGRLADTVRRAGHPYVVSEPVEGRADAETIARETGAELLDIFPLDAEPPGAVDRSIVELVRQQALTLATAYGCDRAR